VLGLGYGPLIEDRHPELGASLNRSLITGISCRYDPVEPLVWGLAEPALRAK
jgi:hypothetical protein